MTKQTKCPDCGLILASEELKEHHRYTGYGPTSREYEYYCYGGEQCLKVNRTAHDNEIHNLKAQLAQEQAYSTRVKRMFSDAVIKHETELHDMTQRHDHERTCRLQLDKALNDTRTNLNEELKDVRIELYEAHGELESMGIQLKSAQQERDLYKESTKQMHRRAQRTEGMELLLASHKLKIDYVRAACKRECDRRLFYNNRRSRVFRSSYRQMRDSFDEIYKWGWKAIVERDRLKNVLAQTDNECFNYLGNIRALRALAVQFGRCESTDGTGKKRFNCWCCDSSTVDEDSPINHRADCPIRAALEDDNAMGLNRLHESEVQQWKDAHTRVCDHRDGLTIERDEARTELRAIRVFLSQVRELFRREPIYR